MAGWIAVGSTMSAATATSRNLGGRQGAGSVAASVFEVTQLQFFDVAQADDNHPPQGVPDGRKEVEHLIARLISNRAAAIARPIWPREATSAALATPSSFFPEAVNTTRAPAGWQFCRRKRDLHWQIPQNFAPRTKAPI